MLDPAWTQLGTLLAIILASAGVLMYYKDRKKVYELVDAVKELKDHPEWAGKALATAYPPQEVASILNAIVEAQKPSVMNFLETEGIPLLAQIGGGQVASDARLARAAKKLGSGATGLQGLMGLVTAPSKKSGIGDLLQYLPLIQQVMGPGGPFTKGAATQPGASPPVGGNGGGIVKW